MTPDLRPLTWLHVQRAAVNLQPPGGGAEALQQAADGLSDVVGNGAGEAHLAVDDHAALPEVQDLQVPEARQVGLQVRQQLQRQAQP